MLGILANLSKDLIYKISSNDLAIKLLDECNIFIKDFCRLENCSICSEYKKYKKIVEQNM